MSVLTGLWYLFVLSLPFLFLFGLVTSLCAMGVRRAGWHRLVAAYRYDFEFPLPQRRLWHCSIGWVSLNGLVWGASDDEALYLRSSRAIPLMPPIRVPWSAVRLVKARSLLLSPLIELHAVEGPPIRIWTPEFMETWIRDAQERSMRAAA